MVSPIFKVKPLGKGFPNSPSLCFYSDPKFHQVDNEGGPYTMRQRGIPGTGDKNILLDSPGVWSFGS